MEKGDPKILNNHEANLNEIRDFYEQTKKAYEQFNPLSDSSGVNPGQPLTGLVVSGVQSSTITTSIVAGVLLVNDQHIISGIKSPLLGKLHRMMPSVLCSFWEFFIKDCYAHFNIKIEEYHSDQIKEVFLIRNCILHNGGIADDSYCSQSVLKKFGKDEGMNLRANDINEFLGYIEDAFKEVKSQCITPGS
ncbi:MAG: hypothetical protein A3A33_04910 [Candidatus Yanofskybacteria bacterium RIFCSPLOWO2_01_FULL_49_25]|uniref:Uncharacterized protein n=1 Tax=Candidatus Yanofskybacteria bacterium RIFCSPLOWO2_01_FULL_49_25 TaxID=1802701 RepID=A0A1F8GQ33_9BACT|nr:MAG: hypothetical protein A3A33_04910 [Candidatus Yanofskybacteria bacterium RIFCSPLOWO2_01_FULL_49_25]